MTWLYYAATSVIFFTTLNLLQRVVGSDSKNPRAMTVVFNSIAAFTAIVIFFVTGSYNKIQLPSNPIAYVSFFAAVLLYGVFERSRFYAVRLLDASIFATIINLSVVVAFAGSIILYSETLTIQKIIGGLLIVSALLLISYEKNRHTVSTKGLLIGTGVSVILGLAWTLDKQNALFFNSNTYNIFIWVLPIIFIIFPWIKIDTLKEEVKGKFWKLSASAVVNVLGYLFQLKALELTEATKVIPVVQTSMLFTVFCGIIFLKERQSIPKKILAGVLAFTGVYLLI